ncbi:cistern family PEP-CTERM protein [Leptolyngbya sp. 15MV]|nr:cistern family PEP-CTERM protein [Leptolyngbya sp. 15MV]
MFRFLLSLGVGAALLASPAAQAATVIDSTDVGSSFTIDFTGQVNGAPAPQLSALLNVVFNGTSNAGRTYLFSYSLTNDSSVSSKIRGFGFNVAGGDVTSASSTGDYPGSKLDEMFPEGLHKRDVCFHAPNMGNGNGNSGCTGGNINSGLGMGQTGTGTFALTFASPQAIPTSLYLDMFVVRYQAISPSLNGGDSGVGLGTPVPAVPEPSTWLMFLLGFFLTGYALRHRRAAQREGEMALA